MVYVESISESHVTPNTRFLALLSQINNAHYSEQETALLRSAFEFAKKAHHGQIRASGEPYVFHVISVAEILLGLKLDTNSIVAALLHDVIEDTEVNYQDLKEEYGDEIATLVDSVTKMKGFSTLNMENSKAGTIKEGLKAENLRKLLLAMAKDVRVVMIKLADRLHNMRTLYHLPARKQRVIAQETAEIYAPLANRLGIWQLKWELEDLSFRYLDEYNYKKIARSLDERKVDRDLYINSVTELLQNQLTDNHIEGEVTGRSKHIFSIWKKMRRKQLDIHQLYDLRAVRIHVNNIKDCYHVLGLVHTLWQHIPMEFDDYIATPKENNYQSIHTAVVGPEGKTLEIQIRTFEMHKHAEFGVAAHWRYKEGGKQSVNYEQKIAWLRQLLEWKDEEQNAGDFIDRFKSEVFQDRVYVLTPEGEIIDMPQGATPLDFAFYVHTEVGVRCRGAKVNGRMVPLSYELKSGDQVNILTTRQGRPSRDWLNPQLGYLKTNRARSKVRSWFKQQAHDQNVAAGRELLEKELQRLGVANLPFEKLVEKFHFQSIDELFVNIGRGDLTTSQIALSIQKLTGLDEKKDEELIPEPIQESIDLGAKGSADISIDGVDNVLTKIAQCCSPVPGDEIVGFITKSRGITIHRRDCHNVIDISPEQNQRIIDVEWNRDSGQGYTVNVEIIAMDRQGLLRDVLTVLANVDINVLGVSTTTNKKDLSARLRITIEISGIELLSRALNKIAQLANVIEVYRVSE